MLLNYQPTFEAWGWFKRSIVNRLVSLEGVEHTTELPANFWSLGLVKKIQSQPIGQSRVEETTEVPANFWSLGLL